MDSELMDLLHRLVEAEERAHASLDGSDEHEAAAADVDHLRRAIFDLWPVEAESPT